MQHLDVPSHYRRAPAWGAVAAFIFDEAKYVEMALSHVMAINLEAPDLAQKFRAGVFPQPGWVEDVRRDARQGRNELLRALRHSVCMISGAMALALGAASLAGKFSLELPISGPKLFGFLGTFLIAWSALFELGEYWKSWEGAALHELVRPKLFMLLFLPGVLLAAIGQLW